MKNVTVAISDTAWHRGRVWAAERNTSLSAVVTYLLQYITSNPEAGRQFGVPGVHPRPKPSLTSQSDAPPYKISARIASRININDILRELERPEAPPTYPQD